MPTKGLGRFLIYHYQMIQMWNTSQSILQVIYFVVHNVNFMKYVFNVDRVQSSSPSHEFANNLELTYVKDLYSLFSKISLHLLISVKFGAFIMYTVGDVNILSNIGLVISQQVSISKIIGLHLSICFMQMTQITTFVCRL